MGQTIRQRTMELEEMNAQDIFHLQQLHVLESGQQQVADLLNAPESFCFNSNAEGTGNTMNQNACEVYGNVGSQTTFKQELPSSPMTPPSKESNCPNANFMDAFSRPVTSVIPPTTQETTPQIKQEPPASPPPSSEGCSKQTKSHLRKSIENSMKQKGKETIMDLFPEEKPSQLTAEDLKKRERRKEQNRRAAKKCRNKKKQTQDSAREEVRQALAKKEELEEEVKSLRVEISNLQAVMTAHRNSGCCLHPQDTEAVLSALTMAAQSTTPFQQNHASQTARDVKRSSGRKRPAVLPGSLSTPTFSPVSCSTPAKRVRFSDNQVVPSLSPNLVAIETSPRTPQTFQENHSGKNLRDPIPSSSMTSPERIFDFGENVIAGLTVNAMPTSNPSYSSGNPTSPAMKPEIDYLHSTNQIVKESTQIPDTIPSNNLPSWDLNNLQPMDLPDMTGPLREASGYGQDGTQNSNSALNANNDAGARRLAAAKQLSEQFSACSDLSAPRPMVAPANQNFVPAYYNGQFQNFGGLISTPADPTLEDLARSCVPPNHVQPLMFQNTTSNNSSKTTEVNRIYEYLVSPITDVNNNSSNFSTTMTNGSKINTHFPQQHGRQQ